MGASSKNREDLEKTIQNLYRVFGRYRFTDKRGDTAFPEACDPEPLLAVPLNQLPAEALDIFHAKALTTWGTSEDFRHFLPRMLELSVFDRFTMDRAVLWGKLAYDHWHMWPKLEIEAIECFSLALWRFKLSQYPNEIESEEIGDLLKAYANAGIGLNDFLETWSQHLSDPETDIAAAIHLGLYLEYTGLATAKRPKQTWVGPSAQDELVSWLLALNPASVIESVFHRASGARYSEALSLAHQYAEWFVSIQCPDG